MLAEIRRSFGLGNLPSQPLAAKIGRKLEEWTTHRDEMVKGSGIPPTTVPTNHAKAVIATVLSLKE
jgi:hypothetical protein